jgi:glutamate-1-semialdehyde 2,1-aminomutase
VLPGGVDSPVRSFAAVGGTPVFFTGGRGAYLRDVDGRRYLDLVNSWGANLLGHAPPPVVAAVRRTVGAGLSFGAPSPLEHELAGAIRRAIPSLERLRFVSSGTEATMSAIRVARGFTGRRRIVKFAGGYHGHSDGLLASAGSGVASQTLPNSAGVPPSIVRDTTVLPYNDLEAVKRAFESPSDTIAAVIVEPVAANMGLVPPVAGFLAGLSRLCRTHGALLIADEVITGFRLRRGAASPMFGMQPDLLALGKVIGGGLPIGAYGGRADVLATVAPLGPVYQAGTLAGTPVVMAAGLATLGALRPAVYRRLDRVGRSLAGALETGAQEARMEPVHVARVGSMLGLFFAAGPVTDYVGAGRTDRARFARFFHAALRGGVYLPPSPFETIFASAAMHESDVHRAAPTLTAAFRDAARPSRTR